VPRTRTIDLCWNALLNDFRRCGLTQAEFCRRRQISLHSFRKHLYQPRPSTPPPTPNDDRSAPTPDRHFLPLPILPTPLPPPPPRSQPLDHGLPPPPRAHPSQWPSHRRPTRVRPPDTSPAHRRRGGTPMFGLSAAVRVYLAKEPADMRKSFDGLSALASGLA